MKTRFLLLLFVLITTGITAQTIEQIKADRNTYLWGEGKATSLSRADNIALSDLISQISTVVESDFTMLREELTDNDESDYSETVKSVINTYSLAHVQGVERIIISNEPDAVVFRYIKRSEIAKIFEGRKNKIIGFVSNGQHSIKNNQIADALRYYNWALTLLRSHPEGSRMTFNDENGNQQLFATWLPFQIQQILANLRADIVKIENMETYTHALLNITCNGNPVTNFDYSYWDGRNWSNIISAKDGLGIVDLPPGSSEISEIRIKTEYVFETEAAIDNELRDVMGKLEPVIFRDAYFNAGAGSGIELNMPSANSSAENMKANVTETENLNNIIETLAKAINARNYNSVRNLFTDEGYKIFQELIQYGNARVLAYDNLNYLRFNHNIVCRSLKMSFSFGNNTRTFVEDVVITFDKNEKIINMVFGLGETAINDILRQDKWSEQVRLNLIDFMEHYKTAFALKRLDYIESIFSDDALIITGYVTQARPSGENPYLNNEIVRYNRHTKEQYINRLRDVVFSNEFINIKFNDNNIRKRGTGGEVYGIQIQQDYFSSSYGDSGYLFLMIDMNDTSKPQIHVRTWQPEKNEDGSIYGLEHF
jgi:hypothetical protein